MNDTRIRYGAREPGHTFVDKRKSVFHRGTAKNTLATIRVGDIIFFGIARCNKGLDIFKKSVGMDIAIGRAKKAKEEGVSVVPDDSIVFMNEAKDLRGYCSVNNIVSLLVFFQGLDSAKVGDVKSINLKERMMELAGISVHTKCNPSPEEWLVHTIS